MVDDPDRRVTLNGLPAVICGLQGQFATVVALPDGAHYQWSWEAAKRIYERGGDFRS